MLVHAHGMARQVHWPAKYLDMTGPSYALSFPRITWMPLFAAFRSFLKQPILSPVQSQNILPLHPFMCAVHLSPRSALALAHLDGFWVWTLGLRLSWDSPGKGPDCVSLPQSLIWVPTCHFAVLLWVCESGTFVGWWPLWWTWQGVVWASPPATVSLSSFVGVQTSFYYII